MKLNCAILHQDAGLQDQLMKYMKRFRSFVAVELIIMHLRH